MGEFDCYTACRAMAEEVHARVSCTWVVLPSPYADNIVPASFRPLYFSCCSFPFSVVRFFIHELLTVCRKHGPFGAFLSSMFSCACLSRPSHLITRRKTLSSLSPAEPSSVPWVSVAMFPHVTTCAPLDSDVYVGEWQRGQREGKGVLSLANGDRSVHQYEAAVSAVLLTFEFESTKWLRYR